MGRIGFNIQSIFVGRKEELDDLDQIWQDTQDPNENKIHVLLNAPGVGKTALLKHFGKTIESKQKGLYIEYSCIDEMEDPVIFRHSIYQAISDTIILNSSNIRDFIDRNHKGSYQRLQTNELNEIEEKLVEKRYDIDKTSTLTSILIRISKMIPIFFMIDEIQVLQTKSFTNNDGEKETFLHYFTRIIKSFLKSHILIVLSGTRYHILSQIGYKIGSPIKGKVNPIIISNLKNEDMDDYIQEFQNLCRLSLPKEKFLDISALLENYHRFMLSFSGGHGRTIEIITKRFLNKLDFIGKDIDIYSDYQNFMVYFIEDTYDFLKDGMLSDEVKNGVQELSSYDDFPLLKSWILTQTHNGLSLGKSPKNTDSMKKLIYSLMNIGLIIQNGQNNYYFTSYFHLMKFLEILDEKFQLFLHQVLHNRFFQLMCGGHSGFGFVFEDILISAFFLLKDVRQIESLPFNPLKLKSVIKIKGKFDWGHFEMVPNILYSSPSQEKVDVSLLDEDNNLTLIQITTQKSPTWDKVEALISAVSEVRTVKNAYHVQGCVISLFPIKTIPSPIPNDLKMIIGDNLQEILGTELYNHLVDVKNKL
jgi:Cdc6-like AAA superfamily ATPase